jgi:hypothetical protein
MRNVARAVHSAEYRTVDEAAPLAARVVVQECHPMRTTPGSAQGAEDVRNDLAMAARADYQDHRALPMNSCAVA